MRRGGASVRYEIRGAAVTSHAGPQLACERSRCQSAERGRVRDAPPPAPRRRRQEGNAVLDSDEAARPGKHKQAAQEAGVHLQQIADSFPFCSLPALRRVWRERGAEGERNREGTEKECEPQ